MGCYLTEAIAVFQFQTQKYTGLRWCVTNFVLTQRQLLPPFGFTSRLGWETRLQRWIHRNALAPLQ
ncbi:hypothetical protein GTQ43_07760 [Nostoc sp. KVJ3]|nr:hypothetical protein [Nostoc sp. KVJ3]